MSVDLTTLVFQTVNFLVLVVLLWRLLLRPLRRHMGERATRISRELEVIERGQRELEQARETTRSELDDARRVRRSALEQARAEAEADRTRILEHAREHSRAERDKLLASVMDEQRRRESRFLSTLAPGLTQLVASLLRELGDAANLHAVTCQRFAAHLEDLSADQRADLRQTSGGDLALVVAHGPAPAPLVSAAKRIATNPLETRVDPSLIAGAQLIAGSRVLDGSVKAQVIHALGRLQ